jgi:hypothetical protein
MQNRPLLAAILIAASTLMAVACGDDDPFPYTTYADGGGGLGDGGTSPDGMAPGDGASVDGGGDEPRPDQPLCPGLTASTGAAVSSLGGADLARFDGITPTLRTAAWTNQQGQVIVADRPNPNTDFRVPAPVTSADAGIAPGAARAALSPDGNEVVVAAGNAFASYTRAAVGEPWSGPAATSLAAINTWLQQQGGTPSEPVIGGSGKVFFFLRTPVSGAPQLCEATRAESSGPWGTPVAHTEGELASADGSHRRRPTGVAWDDLSLFFWDESANVERMAHRTGRAGNFTTFANLGPYAEAVPNLGCNLVYYQSGTAIFNSAAVP